MLFLCECILITILTDRLGKLQIRARAESEQHFHRMADTAPAMLWVTDLVGKCTFLSRGWYEYTGQTEATGLGYGWLEAVHPDDRERSREIFLSANTRQEAFQFDYRLRRHDGEYHWAIDSGRPYFSETGEFLGYIGSVIDIHERKLAEAARHESEARYRTLFNSIDEGFCVCEMLLDNDGKPYDYRFLEVNHVFEQHTGLKNATGKTALELLPNLEPYWIETYGRVALTGESHRFVQGSEVMGRWFNVHAFRFGDPVSHKFAIFFTDITERKHAEERLRQQRESLEQLINSIPVMITIYEPDARLLYLNREFERLIGWTTPDLERINLMESVYPDPEYRESAIQYMQSLIPGWHDFEMRTRNGQILPSSWANIVLPDGRQVGIGMDVRERRKNEVRSERLLNLTTALSNAVTLENVLHAIGTVGLAALGAQRGTIGLVTDNPDVINILAYNYDVLPQDILDQLQVVPMNLSLPMTDSIRNIESVWIENIEQYRTHYPHVVERIQSFTDTQSLVALPLKSQRGVVGGIGASFTYPQTFSEVEKSYLLSIAELCAQALERARLYEIEQRARQQSEEANRLKIQFLGMISHELRTPLTPIKGFVTTLMADDVIFSEQERREFLSVINDESDKLSDLVGHLLDLTRMQAGRLPVSTSRQSLNHIVEIADAQLKALTTKHQLHIQGMDTTVFVEADAHRIAQVLTNLVNNAVKFSPAGTVITLSAAICGRMVQIDVSDQGRGIPPEAREYVFETFRQVNRDGEQQMKGAGLGLAICKGLIEAHGGSIWVQDREGPGTTISFTLPIAK